MFTNTTILVTGGTGSWGYELVRQLLPFNPRKVIVFSRNESKQVAMKRAFDDARLDFYIGDIRDKDALMSASINVDYVFHLAALKHVPVCEDQPYEALKTNVVGTQNVIESALERRVKKVIYISTDKAANPSNFYGMTKAIGEKLIVFADTLGSHTSFVCVRGGNVLGTSESVIHTFKKQIREKNEIHITDLRMTRFFMTIEDAIELLFKATAESKGGEIFVMAMPACKIVEIAEVLIAASGKSDIPILEVGVRPGEKIDEILFSENERETTIVYDEEYFVILPANRSKKLEQAYAEYPFVSMNNYCSNQPLLSKDEIKQLLIKGGFLI